MLATKSANVTRTTLASTPLATAASPAATTGPATEISPRTGNVLSVPADAAPANDISLDDQALARQRSDAVGMVRVAAASQLLHGGGERVTLRDEIAPPSPLPVPVDAARATQSNVAAHQIK